MKSKYYDDIVAVLLEHPKGMRVGDIARHIFNQQCNLFTSEPERLYLTIYDSVRHYLWKQSARRSSVFRHARWGRYALRRHYAKQLQLVFKDPSSSVPTGTAAGSKSKRDSRHAGTTTKAEMRDLFPE